MINDKIDLQQVRDYITGNILPIAFNQWADEKAKDPDNAFTIRWVEGRIDAAFQILQTIDKDAFDEQLAIRHKQTGVE